MKAVRRVVTGIDKHGRSHVLSDGEPSIQYQLEGPSTVEIFELWSNDEPASLPAHLPLDTTDRPSLIPPQSGTRFRLVSIHPNRSFDLASALHRADVVEYFVVLRGEICLVMPDGAELLLTPGNCVVQQGAEHAWHNRSSEPCLIAVVLVGAQSQIPHPIA